MSTPISPDISAACEIRLGEITAADSTALTEFAECRLAKVGISTSYGEDVTQRAFQAVLKGLETDQGGRKPRLVDISDKPAFLNYMRGAISSLVYAMTQKQGFRAEPFNDNVADPDAIHQSPAEQAQVSDLGQQMFPRLRARAPRRLLRTIDAWEPVFAESDRIPARGHRKYVGEVRKLAQDVLRELGGLR
ncbi:MAG TPA: hypothetical protein VFE51_11045 [Verrucomicrobiae bacterium]|nr:hypothetical protein [Verrucomicrobiae bacterium]